MKIIIAGCGKVGYTIAETLSEEGYDISVIDSNAASIEAVTSTCDVMGVVGNAASRSVQEEAGVENADLLIAVTGSDELNMLSCLVAKKVGNCKTIARVRNPIYHQEISFIKEELGLSLAINPEQQAAREISRILRSPSAINVETFAKGRIEMTEFIIPEGNIIDGMSVVDVRRKVQSDILICCVERGEEVCIPNGSFKLKANDVVYFVASPADGKTFFKAIGIETQKIKDVMIIGGSKIAYYLTRILLAVGMNVKIVEKEKAECVRLSDLLPKATIVRGDATNQQLLVEEGIRDVDAVVTLTGMDEQNIFLALEARTMNDKVKVISKANKFTYEEIIGKMGIGSVVYPKYMTAETIVGYVRAMQNTVGNNVETLYKIINNKAEALEFLIGEESPVRNIAISELPLKDDILIAAISRHGEIIYPGGQTMLDAGDRVIIVTTTQGIKDIKDILDL